MASIVAKDFFLDEFALKQFNDTDPNYSGTRIHYDTAKFVAKIQEFHTQGAQLVDGYAPFCKHIFVPNFTGAKLGALALTDNNRKLLQSGYSRRRPEELPVLSRSAFVMFSQAGIRATTTPPITSSRWFLLQDVQPVAEAKFLDCILYSREQLVKEYEAMPEKGKPEDLPQVEASIMPSPTVNQSSRQMTEQHQCAGTLGHHQREGPG